MKRSLRPGLWVAVGALSVLAAGAADAQVVTFKVCLDGSQEVPPVMTAGTGMATVVLNKSTRVVTVCGTYSDLGSNQTLAHIHQAGAGAVGLPIVTLNGTGGQAGTFTGGGTLSQGQVDAMLSCGTYLNVHSQGFGNGEVRGQITDIPNVDCPAELGTDPVLQDCAGDLNQGPVIGDATDNFQVSLDCSGATANGLYVVLIHLGKLPVPANTNFGDVWVSGPKLPLPCAGLHNQLAVKCPAFGGFIIPMNFQFAGRSFTVQGFCASQPVGRLSNALVQTIRACKM